MVTIFTIMIFFKPTLGYNYINHSSKEVKVTKSKIEENQVVKISIANKIEELKIQIN